MFIKKNTVNSGKMGVFRVYRNGTQIGTAGKHRIIDNGNTAGYGYGLQTGTIGKCTMLNSGNPGRYGYGLQVGTPAKRLLSDADNSCGHGYRFKTFITGKCVIPDSGNSQITGYGNISAGTTVGNQDLVPDNKVLIPPNSCLTIVPACFFHSLSHVKDTFPSILVYLCIQIAAVYHC
jgi:hypothetical protein